MKTLFFIFIFSLSLVKAQENFDIFSKQANFDGKNLKLAGKIKLRHPLGEIEAKSAFIKKIHKKDFSVIRLKEDVFLKLNSGDIIKSSKALYNPTDKRLNFDNFVIYNGKGWGT